MNLLDRIVSVLDWPADLIIRHFDRRQFELAMALIMSAIGLLLFASPASIEESSMRYLIDVMPVIYWSTIFFVTGIARIIALALNGNWMPWGAYVRAVGATSGALMWSQWGAALLQDHWMGHPIAPAVIVYCGLAFFEVTSFSRSLRGATSGQAVRQGLGQHREMAINPRDEPDRVYHRDHINISSHQKTVAITKD